MSSASDPDGESSKCEVRSRNKNIFRQGNIWAVLATDISVATKIK